MSRMVVKVGGAVAEDSTAHVLALAAEGHECVVVHGAGPQISARLAARGLEASFVRGRRVTDEAAMAVVREAMQEVNSALCAALGERARGLMGDAIGLRATVVPELGLVGDPLPSRPPAVLEALDEGLIPVVAPLAEGPLNVNADEAAAALAIGLEADHLTFLTDVPGVLSGESVLSRIDAREADRLLGDGTFQGGIVPKLEAAVQAARSGVHAHIGATEVIA